MTAARRIAVVTGTRADYGIWRPVLTAMTAEPSLAPELLICGAHLLPQFAASLAEIEADGFPIAARLATLGQGDRPIDIAQAIGRTAEMLGAQFAMRQPDLLFVLGDRYEMLAAALAAGPFGIPIAHLHGGELSEGSLDDAMRHALTKLSHLHFVAAEPYRRRVLQLGEAAGRVHLVGAPGLDAIRTVVRLDRAALEARLGMALDRPPLVVTFHPPSLRVEAAVRETAALIHALESAPGPLVITHPGADAGYRVVVDAVDDLARRRADVRVVAHLGSAGYFGLLAQAAAMVGNSSSGIIEAASFGLPVVNIGDRQRGRLRAANVIDVAAEAPAISAGIARALDPKFRAGLAGLKNPYGDGHAAERIAQILRDTPFDATLRDKRFIDV